MRTAADTDSPHGSHGLAGLRLDFVAHPDVQQRAVGHDRTLRFLNEGFRQVESMMAWPPVTR